MAPPTPPDLITRALAGDRVQVRALVDALTPVIQARVARVLLRTGCVSRRGNVRQEVEDLVQDIFHSLFAHDGRVLRSWDQERGLSLEQYVGLVAEREVISVLRSRKRSPYTERPTEDIDLEHKAPSTPALDGDVLTRQMTQALFTRLHGSLSPLGFRVFQLLFCDEKTPDDVCAELGMSPDAVYAWRSRIRKTARELAMELSRDADGMVKS